MYDYFKFKPNYSVKLELTKIARIHIYPVDNRHCEQLHISCNYGEK